MKNIYRYLLCLSLALMLAVSAFQTVLASETANGQTEYTITSVQYAYNETGAVHLYDETGETIISTIGNGAKVAVTNGQQEGRTYVQFGTTAGWINNSDLFLQLPQNVTGEANGNSTPANQLTPIQTTAPQQNASKPQEESQPVQTGDEASIGEDHFLNDTEEPVETIGDPEKDHAPIAALYDEETADGSPLAVDVVQLGVVTSIILLNEQRQEVETALLTFGEEIPEDQKLGYVHAPRTGQAGLRETPAKDGKVITQLKAGQLVAVLALEEDYARVNVQGTEGWLRLDCLKYLQSTDMGIISSADLTPLGIKTDENNQSGHSVNTAVNAPESTEDASQEKAADTNAETDDTEMIITGNAVVSTPPQQLEYPAKATLSCKGETDGATSVNLRNLPTKDSAKTAVWRTGVTVNVLSYQGGWYLVEADGVCGFVMEAFLEMEG